VTTSLPLTLPSFFPPKQVDRYQPLVFSSWIPPFYPARSLPLQTKVDPVVRVDQQSSNWRLSDGWRFPNVLMPKYVRAATWADLRLIRCPSRWLISFFSWREEFPRVLEPSPFCVDFVSCPFSHLLAICFFLRRLSPGKRLARNWTVRSLLSE